MARPRPRSVIVTGGSRGLGLAIARKLAAGGFNVIAIARKPTQELAAAMAQANRGKERGKERDKERDKAGALHFVAFDLARIDAIPALVRDLRAAYGAPFALVNNAALGADGALSLMHNSRIEEIVRVNTLAPIVLTKYVVRGMMSARMGRIVNVASIAGFTGYSGLSVYAATKASLIGFTRSLAREVGRLGITVNAVAPGFLDTEMTRGLTAAQRAQVMRRSALRRLAGVDDVANAVAFLLGDGAAGMSGTVLTVDAGATA